MGWSLFQKYFKTAVLICFLVLVGLFISQKTNATPPVSPWLDAANPTLVKDHDLSGNETLPASVAGLGNRDCTDQAVIIRPARLPLQASQSITSCFVGTAFGIAESNGYIGFHGTNIVGRSVNYSGYAQGIIAIPNSADVINYSSAGSNGLYLHFTRSVPVPISLEAASTGELTYRFIQPASASLRDQAGNLLPAQTDSLSFSNNGDWMVVDSPFRGLLRVNVKTLETLPFTTAFNYNIGISPNLQTAISSDGRYAVVASKNFSYFRLFDLSTCGAVPATINGPVTCQSRDLLPFMQGQLNGFLGVFSIRFTSNDALSLYGLSNSGSGNKLAKFSLIAPGKNQSKLEYLALGDSFASGEGAYSYRQGTDVPLNKCHLSDLSYPRLISADLNFNSTQSMACSGATIKDITTTDPEYEGQAHDHIKRRDRISGEILSSFSPGYLAQLEFVKTYKPDVITVSTVGNDIGFSNILKRCIEPDTCYESYEDRLEIVREVNSKFALLTSMYKKIKDQAAYNSKIYVIGYPQLAMNDGNCDINVHLSNDEIKFSNLLVDYLNNIVKRAADNVGVQYVDVTNAMQGHRLCEATGSNVAVNGLTAGDDGFVTDIGPFGNESYHPNVRGHQLFEQTILSATQNLTTSMPVPNPNSTVPVEDPTLAILSAQHTGRPIYQVNYDEELANNVVTRGGVWSIAISAAKFELLPLTAVKAFLHSNPADLGTYTTDTAGNLAADVTIPADTQPGFHTLHLQGQNMAGEPTDIYKTIYVAADANDLNGNGIPNASDPCLIIQPSGQDVDMDGIDDACDSVIGEAPTPPSVSFTAPTAADMLTGTIQIDVNAQDAKAIAGVQLKIDGNLLGAEDTQAPYQTSWDTTGLPNGPHTITVIARNTFGLSTTTEEQVTIYNVPPNTPPTISISSPADTTTISGTAQISANASDDKKVAGVQFQINGVNFGPELSTPPYTVDWDTKAVADGQYTITATARDEEGLSTTSTVVVNVYNPLPPSIIITSPADGATISDNAQVHADATDVLGITGVQFQLDGVNVGPADTQAPYEANIDTTVLANNSSHTITAIATNSIGLTNTTSITANVYNIPPPPTVSITSPANNVAVSGTVAITADATDSVGVAGVQFKVDGANFVGAEDTIAPYSTSWDSKTVGNGSHTIYATARSTDGQTTTASINVNVQNVVAPPPPPPVVPPLVKLVQIIVKVVIKIVTTLISLFKR